jgi:hypothetical protein
MQKILSILLAVIYLSASSGLALQVHYCMDEVSGVSLAADDENSCGKCGMEKNSGTCCKDETKFVKLDDAHKLLASAYLQHPVATILNSSEYFEQSIAFSNLSDPAIFNAHAPPVKTNRPLNLLHCVFRV